MDVDRVHVRVTGRRIYVRVHTVRAVWSMWNPIEDVDIDDESIIIRYRELVFFSIADKKMC